MYTAVTTQRARLTTGLRPFIEIFGA